MRIALGIEYFGSGFYGWQYQPNLQTIEGELERAIGKVANHEIFVHCAGRTDANVHAKGQVIHFDTKAKRHIDAWIWGVNANLPREICVRWARMVDYSFHARFTAIARRYQYYIYNHPIRPAILNNRVTWHYYPLDEIKMHRAGQCLLGEHDFSSFRSAQCSSNTPNREVMNLKVERKGNLVILEIEANAFLHHMVRNIAGTLMKVGGGFKEEAWVNEVLKARDRKLAGEKAPAQGLYLTQVSYPERYDFPLSEPIFLL